MHNQDIKLLLIKTLNLEEAHITGDSNHIKIIAIGDIFKGLSSVKRQKTVYAPLINVITNKHIHAISILCYTPKEWKKNNINNSNYA